MTKIPRREFLRSGVLVTAGLAMPGLLAACAKKTAAPAGASSLQELADARLRAGAKQGLSVFLGGEDYVVGASNYVAFGVVEDQVGPVMGAAARVWVAPTSDPKAPVTPRGPFAAPWQAYAKPDAAAPAPQGVNALELRFDGPGVWLALVEAQAPGGRLLGSTAIQVKPTDGSSTKIEGQKAIPSETPTLADHRGVDPICTRVPPCAFHRVTLAKAITLGKPVAFIVATPRFCMSRTCGPNLEELILASKEVGDRVTFVHAEVYVDDEDAPAKQLVSSTFKEWGFQSEPWLFLIEPGGRIASRFEGPVTKPEILSKLTPLLG